MAHVINDEYGFQRKYYKPDEIIFIKNGRAVSPIENANKINDLLEININEIIFHGYYINTNDGWLKNQTPCLIECDNILYYITINHLLVQLKDVRWKPTNKVLTEEILKHTIIQKCVQNNVTYYGYGKFNKMNTFVKLECNICKHKWNPKYYAYMYNNSNCQQCANKKPYSYDEIKNKIVEKSIEYNHVFRKIIKFSGNKTVFVYSCNTCGSIHETTWNWYENKNIDGCQTCNSGSSKSLTRDIDSKYPFFEKEKSFLGCKNKLPLRFDRYSSEKNILIEYDGKQHFSTKSWGGIEQYKKTQINDKIKTEYAINNGYNFIRIAYYEDHVQALESFLALVQKHPDKQIVQIYGEVQILDNKSQ